MDNTLMYVLFTGWDGSEGGEAVSLVLISENF